LSGLTIAWQAIAQQCPEKGHQLEGHGEPGFAAEAVLGFAGAMPNRGEGAFDGNGCADVLLMFGREVIECQEHVAVFDQFGDGLVVFHAICRDEVVERSRGIHPRFSLPDVVQMALCPGLGRLRHRVQHITRFAEPAALLFLRAKDLAQSTSEVWGVIPLLHPTPI